MYDKHLISFETAGKIILSNSMEKAAFEKIGVSGQEKIDNLSKYNVQYLERHHQVFAEDT